MSFLAICKRLRSEAGLSGTGPASVENQTGVSEKIVEWIQTADTYIQNLYANWEFLQDDFSFPTVVGQQVYTPTEAGEPTLANWKFSDPYDVRVYLAEVDESTLDYIQWVDFKSSYLFGSSRSDTGRPIVFTVKPDNSIVLYPKPDAVYTINGEFFHKAVTMTGNTDEPQFPDQFHMILVWRALMLYAAFDAADEKYGHGQNEFKALLANLSKDQLPIIRWGEPLA